MNAQMPPGWYDDPDCSPNAERRWDGHNWTPERRRKTTHTRPPAYAQPPQAQASYPQPARPPSWTMQPPWSLNPTTAQPFPQPLTSASGHVPKVKGFWAGLPTIGRVALVAAPIVVILIAIIAAGASSVASSAAEDNYISALDNGGIHYSSKAQAIKTAHSICDVLDAGESVENAVYTGSDISGYSIHDTAYIVGASVRWFCNEHKDLIYP
jgi:hypothetical protein